MGAWGVGVFDDDTARDVRDEFVEHLEDGLSSDEAARLMIDRWSPASDHDLEAPFWLALAATQWRLGRLSDFVRDEALRIIETGRDAEGFPDPEHRVARAHVLEALRIDLTGPPRKPRQIKRRLKIDTPWEVGLVVTYRLQSGRYCLFRVSRHHIDRGGRSAVLEVLPGMYERPPSATKIAFLWPARNRYRNARTHISVIGDFEQNDRVGLTSLGRSPLAPPGRWARRRWPGHTSHSFILMERLDRYLNEYLGYA